jgi:hypothetical protein
MVEFLLTYGVHSSIYVSSRVGVDGTPYVSKNPTIYLHPGADIEECTPYVSKNSTGRWWGFYLHMEYTLLSMSTPGWG